MEAALRRLLRAGLQRGVLGGSRAWTIAGALGAGGLVLKRLAGRPQAKTVYSSRLRPGQSVTVNVSEPAPSRRRRRAHKRT
ncbi:MAG: hypothetical protein ACYDH5_14045 [Acidimicrobiales bacterium]